MGTPAKESAAARAGRPKHDAEDEGFGKALVPAGALTTFGLLAKSLEPRQTRS